MAFFLDFESAIWLHSATKGIKISWKKVMQEDMRNQLILHVLQKNSLQSDKKIIACIYHMTSVSIYLNSAYILYMLFCISIFEYICD